MRVTVAAVTVAERPVRFRLPFRFGVVTLTEAPQAFVHVRVRDHRRRETVGVAAEMLAPKWFDKNPALSNDDNFEQLRRALRHAADLYRAAGEHTPFGLFAACYEAQLARCAADGLNPLVASFGLALLDRAVLDASCKIAGVSFWQAMRANLPGIVAGPLTPDLAGVDLAKFLATRQPLPRVQARHTVGLVDPILHNETPVGDGLPETLREVAEAYGHRWFKLKVGGDIEADLVRLGEIAAALEGRDYRCTLDGNEQFGSADQVVELLCRIAADPGLADLWPRIAFVEQPLSRAVALSAEVAPIAQIKPVIIDESDATLDSFPAAIRRGYDGVSSKSCKGIYKSVLNAVRAHALQVRARRPLFMSAEDLTMQAGLAVQQDLALVSFLGNEHVERNGHHYVNGLAACSEAEQQSFLAGVPGLYERSHGAVRLAIADGALDLRGLDGVGFASAGQPDWAAMTETFSV